MKISVSLSPTASRFGPLLFAGDLPAGLETVARLGYDGVELSLLDSAGIDRRQLKASLGDLGLRAFAIATGQTWVMEGCSLFNEDPVRRQKAVDRLRGHIDLAAELGSMVIVGGIRGVVQAADKAPRAALLAAGQEAVRACAEHAEAGGVGLLLEPINRYETNVVNTLAEGLEMIRTLGSPSLKLLPDTFHMNIEEASIPGSLTAAGQAIGYVHFADSNRLAPGWGHLDFEGVVAALADIGYGGPIGIEVLPKPDSLSTAEQAIRHVRGLIARSAAAGNP